MNPTALATALALSAVLAGQTQERSLRQWITGKVLRADGKPWPEASVELHSLSWRTPPDATFQDHVTVKTTAEGLFRAQVLPGRDYDVWCASPTAANRYTTTNMVAGATAGTPIELKEAAHEHVAVTVQLHGHQLWAERGPLVPEVFCMLDNRLDLPCELAGAGRWRLPTVPMRQTFFRVRDRDGVDLASGVIPLRLDLRQAQLAGGAPDPNPDNMSRQRARFVTTSVDETAVHLPAPVPFDVVVSCAGKPAPDVLLTWCDRADHRPWGRTGADGIARILVPAAWGKGGEGFFRHLSLYLQGPGVGTVNAYADELPARAADGSTGRWELVLPPGRLLRGRLWWREGRPAARVPILVHTGLPGGAAFGGRAAGYGGSPLCYWTDDEGRFAVPGRIGFLAFQLSTHLAEAHLRELPPSPLPYAPAVVLASGSDVEGKDQDLGDLVFASMAAVDVDVVDEKGLPLPGHRLHYREQLDAEWQEKRVCYTRADWQGRIRLLARPGTGFMVTAGEDGKGEHEAVVPVKDKPTQVTLHGQRK